jgi:hypothetical protein
MSGSASYYMKTTTLPHHKRKQSAFTDPSIVLSMFMSIRGDLSIQENKLP